MLKSSKRGQQIVGSERLSGASDVVSSAKVFHIFRFQKKQAEKGTQPFSSVAIITDAIFTQVTVL
jgi:hypothetical protein